MAYLVVDRHGRREFRWLEGRRRRSRRVPRGEAGDRLLAELRAAHEARSDAKRACRAEAAAAAAEADAMRRDVEALDAAVRAGLTAALPGPLAYDPVHGTITRRDRMSSARIKGAADAPSGPKPKSFRWCMSEARPVGMDPTYALRVE
jgi:hypothetical protein